MGYATIPLPTSIGEADVEQFVQAMVTEGLHCGASLSYVIGYIMVNTGYMRARV